MGKSKSGIPVNRANLDSERGRLLMPNGGGVTASLFNNHKTNHQNGGADEISVAGLSGVPAIINQIVCNENQVVCNNNNVVYNEV